MSNVYYLSNYKAKKPPVKCPYCGKEVTREGWLCYSFYCKKGEHYPMIRK